MSQLMTIKQSKRSPYRVITPNDPLDIIVDLANTDDKAMIHGNFGEEIWFSHAVRVVNSDEYANIKAKNSHHPTEADGTARFEVIRKNPDKTESSQGYVVGFEAASASDKKQFIGPAKYIRGHFDVLFLAVMLHLYPQSHRNIHVVVLHPTDATAENINDILNIIGGLHKIRLTNGEIITYGVREVVTLDEPVAAINTYILNQSGLPYEEMATKIKPGTKFLNVDIGGGLTQFCECRVTKDNKIVPDTTNPPVIKAGIQNIVPAFQNILKSSKRTEFQVFKNMQQIPIEMLHNALMNLQINIRGEDFDCSNEVGAAMSVIADPVRREYENRFALGVEYAHILLSGGGGGICEKHFKTAVFDHSSVNTAEGDPEKMRFDKIRGASKGRISSKKVGA